MNDDKYLNPEWPKNSVITPHDWMRYVSQDVRLLWSTFTPGQRVALGQCFEEIATFEDWD